MDHADLRAELLAGLRAQADPERAAQMERYMKGQARYWGVPKPALKGLLAGVLAGGDKLSWVDARDTAQAVWAQAERREEQYLALLLTGAQRHRRHLRLAELPLFERWIVEGAWWDLVDDVAVNRLGPMYAEPQRMEAEMRAWAEDGDLWKRRSAILSQLKRREQTDTELLEACILPSIERPEFWLRKAIGWVLRQYARTDPDWVVAFVADHPEMSGLSRREATKHLGGYAG